MLMFAYATFHIGTLSEILFTISAFLAKKKKKGVINMRTKQKPYNILQSN